MIFKRFILVLTCGLILQFNNIFGLIFGPNGFRQKIIKYNQNINTAAVDKANNILIEINNSVTQKQLEELTQLRNFFARHRFYLGNPSEKTDALKKFHDGIKFQKSELAKLKKIPIKDSESISELLANFQNPEFSAKINEPQTKNDIAKMTTLILSEPDMPIGKAKQILELGKIYEQISRASLAEFGTIMLTKGTKINQLRKELKLYEEIKAEEPPAETIKKMRDNVLKITTHPDETKKFIEYLNDTLDSITKDNPIIVKSKIEHLKNALEFLNKPHLIKAAYDASIANYLKYSPRIKLNEISKKFNQILLDGGLLVNPFRTSVNKALEIINEELKKSVPNPDKLSEKGAFDKQQATIKDLETMINRIISVKNGKVFNEDDYKEYNEITKKIGIEIVTKGS